MQSLALREVSSKSLDMDSVILKIAKNRAIMGPKKGKIQSNPNKVLSNSADYSRFLLGGSFSSGKEPASAKEAIKPSKGVSVLLSGKTPDDAKTAVIALSYWDKNLAQDEKDYTEKVQSFYARRNEVYSSMGYNPAKITSKTKPELNREQLAFYNSTLSESSVVYYEYHLALHIPGRKNWIRSKTFRSLRSLSIEELSNKVSRWLEKDSDNLESKVIIESYSAVNGSLDNHDGQPNSDPSSNKSGEVTPQQ